MNPKEIHNRILAAISDHIVMYGPKPKELLISTFLWRILEENANKNFLMVTFHQIDDRDPEYMGLIIRKVLTKNQDYLKVI